MVLQCLNIHNFRCFQNFEFRPGDNNSLLLIGKNGSGKSTLGRALWLFQQLGQGVSRISSLLQPADFTLGRTSERISLKIEILLGEEVFSYSLVLDKPDNFWALRVVEEAFLVDGNPVFTRQEAQVALYWAGKARNTFSLDWHSVALPLINDNTDSPLQQLRNWLGGINILNPIPQYMTGLSQAGPPIKTLSYYCLDFAPYLTELLITYPATYGAMYSFLKELIPDLDSFENALIVGSNARQLIVKFGNGGGSHGFDFAVLSEGEKIMFLCAAVLAAQKAKQNPFVFWDEPDNYLALPVIESFVGILRQISCKGGQLWITSHNNITMDCGFSHENTFLMRHENHWSPVELRPVRGRIDPKESVSRKFRRDELEEIPWRTNMKRDRTC